MSEEQTKPNETETAAAELAAKEAATKATADAAQLAKNLSLNKQTDTTVPYVPVGSDSKLNAVGTLLAEKGVKSTQAIVKSFDETGELSIAHQAELVDKLGDSLASLVVNQLTDHAAAQKNSAVARNASTMDYANKKFGGSDPAKTWAEMKDFANSPEANISAEDRAQLNNLIKAGGLSAQLAVDKIHALHNGNAAVSTPADLLNGDSYTTSGFEPISKLDYVAELEKAVNSFGYDSNQVRQLQAKRNASIVRGY